MFVINSVVQALLLSASVVVAIKPFEQLNEVPRGWELVGAAKDATAIKLRLSLKQQNVDKFYEEMLAVSTPDNAKYGQHYEGLELRSLLAPTAETSGTVISWLQDNNITSIADDGDYIVLQTNVGAANKLLSTEFQWFRNADEKTPVLRTLQYSVPDEIASHINFVQPTTRFGGIQKLKSTVKIVEDGEAVSALKWTPSTSSKVDPACNTSITPTCLLQLYNVHYKGDPKSGSRVGYASFLEEYARYSDLEKFEAAYAPYAAGQNFTVIKFNGGLDNQTSTDDSGEANLDNQYALSLGYPNPVTEFSVGGRGLLIPDGDSPTPDDNTNEPYLDFLLALLKLPNSKIPQVISISYGENEQEIPVSYAEQVCQLFAQLGARGTSVLFSSGDSGTGDFCLSNDGKNTVKFQPQFPASCPWITSVGGTRNIEPEEATYFSSGGFSNLWPRPLYQELAVRGYLAQIGKKNDGYFNKKGRGFPDIAAQSYRYHVYDSGKDVQYQGTSCASPAAAGIISLLNSARLSSKLPPFGFLNPWLYTIGQIGFNDIVHGAGTGCNGLSRFNSEPNGSPVIPGASWNATKGWDPVTGLGTPDFGKLLKLSTPWVKNEGGQVPA
ncbi:hypothetical protein V495_00707 [Pseudogymnoascus sp. VKM F-4514 (FW-929)]|nr:hypothetical protein V495_00707 [Pseudogymnoascus sp. VKM F-4514 (FW-929)]KFY65780.1 hypothetical protein V497_01284 [Pseudogymnoascus sp. VKM F-4516 (FW-969)]